MLFPLGTLLGIYSWTVLTRTSVEKLLACGSSKKTHVTAIEAGTEDSQAKVAAHLEAGEQMWRKFEEEHGQPQAEQKQGGDENTNTTRT